MLKVNDRVYHYLYGEGTILSISNEKGTLVVCFDKEYEVVVGEIIDTDSYFEDNRRLEKTSIIEVPYVNVEKINIKLKEVNYYPKERETHCHTCKKTISTATHDKCKKCGWIMCDCGACRCNYKKSINYK